jgi:hypothetical protein
LNAAPEKTEVEPLLTRLHEIAEPLRGLPASMIDEAMLAIGNIINDIPVPDGERSWSRRIGLIKRAALLRRLADTHFAGLPVGVQAREIARCWSDYSSSAWLRDMRLKVCPHRHVGRRSEYFFHLQKIYPGPLRSRRIVDILNATSPPLLAASVEC